MRAENITGDDQHNRARTGRPGSTHLVAVCLARNSCYSVHGCSAIRKMSSALAFQNLVVLEEGECSMLVLKCLWVGCLPSSSVLEEKQIPATAQMIGSLFEPRQ